MLTVYVTACLSFNYQLSAYVNTLLDVLMTKVVEDPNEFAEVFLKEVSTPEPLSSQYFFGKNKKFDTC